MRKISLGLFTLFIYFSMTLSAGAAANNISLLSNEKNITSSVTPQVINNSVFLPIRSIAEESGAEVDYENQQIQIGYNGKKIKLSLNAEAVIVIPQNKDEKVIALKESAYLLQNRIYVSPSDLADIFAELEINYDVYNQILQGNLSLYSMVIEDGFGMGRARYYYNDISSVYQALLAGQLRRVPEPRTEYGATFTVYDYYALTETVNFYRNVAFADLLAGNNQPPALNYELYHMYEGEPEFGNDSQNLLRDVKSNYWYAFDDVQYRTAVGQATKKQPLERVNMGFVVRD